MILRKVFIALVLLATTASAEVRKWRTVTGQTFEAEFIRADATNGFFRTKGRDDPYPLDRLSAADRLFINQTIRAQAAGIPAVVSATTAAPVAAAAPTTARNGLQFAGQPLTDGGAAVVDFPITDKAHLRTIKEAYGKESAKAKMLLALPAGFQPAARNYPLLIVSSTTDGNASSIGSAKDNYLPDATTKGYVVLAVDGEFGKPEAQRDSTDFRWALVASALEALGKEWPKARTWPIVSAGISGGGGYASHQAMLMLDKQLPLMGILLAVTGYTPGAFPAELRRAPRAALRNLPIYFTAGESDQIATKEITGKANEELERSGFKNVRFEKFPGGHELHRPHLQAALDWFVAEQRKASPNSLPPS